MLAGVLAFMVAALFTGAAFYVSFAEQPARLVLDDRALLTQWKLAYKRGLAMQAPLAIVGFVLGIIAWRLTGRIGFLVGATLLVANWPWTILGMMPTNKALMVTELQEAGPGTRALLVKWNRLHSVRTALGFLTILTFLMALLSN
jgi:hypothetical protein